MTSLAPPKPRHDCTYSMRYERDACWCELCDRTWTMGPHSWEPVTGPMARSVRARALRERSAS